MLVIGGVCLGGVHPFQGDRVRCGRAQNQIGTDGVVGAVARNDQGRAVLQGDGGTGAAPIDGSGAAPYLDVAFLHDQVAGVGPRQFQQPRTGFPDGAGSRDVIAEGKV